MSKLLERLLERRGIREGFLRPRYEDLPEGGGGLPDIEKATERILAAISKGEKILIYGDYDADGVTASAVMRESLRMAGAGEVEVMLPDRFKDGYGMSKRAVERAAREGVSLVVTVDCGSNNGEVIAELKEKGIETVVTDHHEILGEVPEAAVVNPKRADFVDEWWGDEGAGRKLGLGKDGGLRELAGVGVAFMVARELVRQGAIPAGQEKWLLDLVAIGTLCDSMRMTGVNRILGYYGLKVLAKTRRPGVVELLRAAGVKRIDSAAVGFMIGPRINAAGRLKSAELAFDLITADSAAKAAKLAKELNDLNSERKQLQEQATREIATRGVGEGPVIVAAGEWHEGILGIVAGRLVEEYQRPAFVLSLVDGVYKGSGRSFGEFNLAEVIGECGDVIIGGGGHAAACGVKIAAEGVDEFRVKVNEYYRSLRLVGQERFLRQKEDVVLEDLGELSLEFLEAMRELEPFGEGNKEPVFLLSGVMILNARRMGAEGQHLGLLVRGRDGVNLKLVAFNAPEEWLGAMEGERVDIFVRIEENEWNGVRSVQGRILEIK